MALRPYPTRLAILLATAVSPALAQIELGEEWLLDAGFALDLGVDTLYAEQANIGPGGGDQAWAFTGLTAHDTARLRARPASTGRLASAFPTADFIFTADVAYGIVRPGTETYMQRADDDVFIVGIDDPIGSPLIPQVTLNQPFAFQSAPILYEQVGDASTRIVRTIDADTAALALEEPILTGFDSVRVTVGQSVDYVVDAWGSVEVDGLTYDALRIRSETVTELFVEASLPGQPFTDLTDLVGQLGFGAAVGADTTVDYSWVVAEVSFPVVQVTLDRDGRPEEVRFALADQPSSVRGPVAAIPLELRASVGADAVALEIAGGPAGTRGALTVYDAAGRRIAASADLPLDGARVELPTADWPAGVKLATVWMGGRPVATRRFVTR